MEECNVRACVEQAQRKLRLACDGSVDVQQRVGAVDQCRKVGAIGWWQKDGCAGAWFCSLLSRKVQTTLQMMLQMMLQMTLQKDVRKLTPAFGTPEEAGMIFMRMNSPLPPPHIPR